MNDQELENILKSASQPEPPPEFWEQLPKRITAKIHWQSPPHTARPAVPRRFGFLDWAFGVGVVVVVCAAFLILQPGRWSLTGDPFALAEKCYRETEALFPNQIQSIVFDETGPRIVLAEKADVPASPPLYLKICGPLGCQEIVTFSGQQVWINGQVCDVLTDAAGDVIIAGESVIWSSHEPGVLGGRYHIEVRALRHS